MPGEYFPAQKVSLLRNGLTEYICSNGFDVDHHHCVVSLWGYVRANGRPKKCHWFLVLQEMLVEGFYGFAEHNCQSKVRSLFLYFMTFTLIILVANWMETVPCVDSIGIWEYKPHFYAVQLK